MVRWSCLALALKALSVSAQGRTERELSLRPTVTSTLIYTLSAKSAAEISTRTEGGADLRPRRGPLMLLVSIAAATAFAPASSPCVRLVPLGSSHTDAKRSNARSISLQLDPLKAAKEFQEMMRKEYEAEAMAKQAPVTKVRIEPGQTLSDSDFDYYARVPWWAQGSAYSERQRADRRTVFMHDDWVKHRSSDRFLRNLQTIGSSSINQALSSELTFVTFVAAFVVVFNMLFHSYQGLDGVGYPGLLIAGSKSLSLPALPFSITMPALSLLLVFRCNTGYARWNEARTLWGGVINNCRNIVRQSNSYFPNDVLKRRMAAETAAYVKALRNFLRGPSDDATLRSELYELVDAGLMPLKQADAVMKVTLTLTLIVTLTHTHTLHSSQTTRTLALTLHPHPSPFTLTDHRSPSRQPSPSPSPTPSPSP